MHLLDMVTPAYRDGGLGFDIDWGGIVGSAVKSYGAIQQASAALRVQKAQQAEALRAQTAEFQFMQYQQAPVRTRPVMAYPRARPSEIPSWMIPAAVGLGVLFLMRNRGPL